MDKRKHVLVISQFFYPEQFRINDICKEWVKRGYKVTVVTGIPNYPQGKFYDGYGFIKKRKEKWNGIDIIRIPLIPRGHNSIGLVLNYISFVISGMFWKTFTKIKADCVFSFAVSPMTQVLIGCWYAKKNKIPHYVYVQDLWPENVQVVTGINSPLVIKPIDKMVDYIYSNSNEIFATSPSFVETICNRKVKVDRNKVHYWPQYAEEFYERKDKYSISEIEDSDSFKIIFTGNIGYAQGLDILPKSAALLKEYNIKFIVVGDGRYLKQFKKDILQYDVEDKFILIPRQPAEKIPYYLSACDLAFLSFSNNDLWKKTIPAKLQSYMACEMPIIAAAEGETSKVINKAKCGLSCKIGDEKALAESIIALMNKDLKDMAINSRNYFKANFDKKLVLDYFEKYLDLI